MGIFSFVKDVGHKLGIGEDSPKAEDLKNNLDANKLGTSNVAVKVEGDKVFLTGKVADHATLEKAVLAVGNARGVAQVNTAGLLVDQQETAVEKSVFYTVKSGDNLWKIAETNYGKGNGDKNSIIFEANKPMLTSADKIYPGQVLRIPPLK